MIKLLHIINSLAHGGAEKLIVDLLPIIHKDVKTELLILTDKKSEHYISELRNQRIVIHNYNINMYNPIWIIKIKKLLENYDIVHVHLFPSLYWSSLAYKISNTKAIMVYTEHSTQNRRRNIKLLRNVERYIYSVFDSIICISSGTKESLIDYIGDKFIPKVQIINNGVNLERFFNASALKGEDIPWGCNKNMHTILMVARFSESKDQETAIRSLVHLDNNYQLVLVGIGPNLSKCMRLVRKLNLENRVLFLGIRRDIPELMKTADICLLSSNWEGFGIVAVEAMASGTPLIASDVHGLSEIVNGAGLLFAKKNDSELAELINLLISDNELYRLISSKSITRAWNYSIDTMKEKYLEIYNMLILN